MRIVAALGGNALLRRGEPMTAELQRQNVRRATAALAPLIGEGHQLVITHGNGPQVGLLALQADSSPGDGRFPLDILGAETEGMIGYLIEQELQNVLPAGALTATLLTQIRVDRRDPAFNTPTKPIGQVYAHESVARRLMKERGWNLMRDGDRWRRAVPSPRPIEILEARVIEFLVEKGVTVICAGGGGIPVIESADGSLMGVEAVIDKDHASALLARTIKAEWLLLLTDIEAVRLHWGRVDARSIAEARPMDLDPGQFAEGTMRPKIEAAIGFVNETGKRASIGRLDDVASILAGRAGTTISLDCAGLGLREEA
jgi:carbamate kinase